MFCCEAPTSRNKPCRIRVPTKNMKCRYHRKLDTPAECCICLDKMCADSRTLSCGHVFHGKCIQTWLNKCQFTMTCPMCRHVIKDSRTMKWLSQENENDESSEWQPEENIETSTLPPRQRRRRLARLRASRHRITEENSIVTAVYALYDRLFNMNDL